MLNVSATASVVPMTEHGSEDTNEPIAASNPSTANGPDAGALNVGFSDPQPELNWYQRTELVDPIMIVGFAGWNDAGDAATGAVEHLADVWNAEPLASIDPENFYDFTQIRPNVSLSDGGERRLEWPRNEFQVAKIAGSDRHAILLSGIEPQLRWRTFSSFFTDVAESCGVSMVITLGALLADVPHTRPTPVYGSSGNPETAARLDLEASTYEGPTGIVGVLHSALSTAGFASASLWAAVPSYVPGATSPKARLALLERLTTVTEASIVIDQLVGDSASYERQVSAFVEQDPDTVSYVTELEEHYDSADEPEDSAGLVEEVERFLRDQKD